MRSLLKIIFIGIVILGLVAAYIPFSGDRAGQQQEFQGPAEAPSTENPSELPPGQQLYIE